MPWALGTSHRLSFLLRSLAVLQDRASTFGFGNSKFVKAREVVNSGAKIIQYSYQDS